MLAGCNLVVDCTAEEATLGAMEQFPWVGSAYLASLSFGWHVHRLYAVGALAKEFTRERVVEILLPLEEEDLANHPSDYLSLEGPGCWHATFPGRSDDVWMMSAMGTKEIERFLTYPKGGVRATVLQVGSRGHFLRESLGR